MVNGAGGAGDVVPFIPLFQGKSFEFKSICPNKYIGGRPSIIQLAKNGLTSNEGAMPRLARLDSPGILHHIIIGDIERRKIFPKVGEQNTYLADNR